MWHPGGRQRTCNKGKEVERGLFKQAMEVSRSMTPGLPGDFDDPDTHWKGSTAGCLLSSRCLSLTQPYPNRNLTLH